MAGPMPLAKHGFLLGKNEEQLYEIIDAAMSIAAWRNPKAFVSRRDLIAKNLFSLPKDVIGSCYQKSHSTMENTNKSGVTKDVSKVVTDDCVKKGSDSSKKDDKKVGQNFEASRVINSSKFLAANKKKIDVQNVRASKIMPLVPVSAEKGVTNFEASKRKLEQRYKQLRKGVIKTKFIGLMEIKEFPKPTRDVKRARLQH